MIQPALTTSTLHQHQLHRHQLKRYQVVGPTDNFASNQINVYFQFTEWLSLSRPSHWLSLFWLSWAHFTVSAVAESTVNTGQAERKAERGAFQRKLALTPKGRDRIVIITPPGALITIEIQQVAANRKT